MAHARFGVGSALQGFNLRMPRGEILSGPFLPIASVKQEKGRCSSEAACF